MSNNINIEEILIEQKKKEKYIKELIFYGNFGHHKFKEKKYFSGFFYLLFITLGTFCFFSSISQFLTALNYNGSFKNSLLTLLLSTLSLSTLTVLWALDLGRAIDQFDKKIKQLQEGK